MLVVTYLFPPLDCGVGRQIKFVKYLPRYGWNPVVLSVKASRLRPIYDSSRGRGIPRGLEVHRTHSLEVVPIQTWIPTMLKRYLNINPKWFRPVDPYLGWIPFALHKGTRILQEGNVDVIYSTSRPNTDHLIAYLLKKRFNIPWIADFRDAWTQNPYINYPSPILRIENRLERMVIEKADKIMTITESIKNGFLEKYPEIQEDKIVVLPHGSDPDDFDSSTSPRSLSPMLISARGYGMTDYPSKYPRSPPFTLVYVGSIYGKRVGVSRVFLDAVRDLLCENQEIGLSILFVGNARQIQDEVDLRGLEKTVTLIPHVSHEEAINYMMNSHVLLLISGSRGEMSGKLVEYLQTGKPILALSHVDSTISKIVKSTNTGIVADPLDVQSIKESLQWIYTLHKIGSLRIHPDPEEVGKYDIRRITERLSTVLQEMIKT